MCGQKEYSYQCKVIEPQCGAYVLVRHLMPGVIVLGIHSYSNGYRRVMHKNSHMCGLSSSVTYHWLVNEAISVRHLLEVLK